MDRGLSRLVGLIVMVGAVSIPFVLLVTKRLNRLVRAQLLLLLATSASLIQFAQQSAQYSQIIRLRLPLPKAIGVISFLNAEWVPLLWLLLVFAALVATYRSGCRNVFVLLASGWTLFHALEHLYLLIQFARVSTAVDNYGIKSSRFIEALPGILGHDGWLARHAGSLRPTLGPLLAAPRVAIHFWWAVGDVVLPLLALIGVSRSTRSFEESDTSHRSIA
jgi:hypothetical protein